MRPTLRALSALVHLRGRRSHDDGGHHREGAPLRSARIAAEIGRRIASGELAGGDRVPSTRQITREWGVAMATATKALAALQQQGLVHAEPASARWWRVRVDTRPSDHGAAQRTRSGRTSPRPAADREPGLSRQRVVAAAIEIADTEGLAALSMRRVAAELGTATMSLYRHVRSKDDLLMLMVDSQLRPLSPAARARRRPGGSRGVVPAAVGGATSGHPWLAQWVSMTRPQLVPSAMAHTERAMAILADLGLGRQRAAAHGGHAGQLRPRAPPSTWSRRPRRSRTPG